MVAGDRLEMAARSRSRASRFASYIVGHWARKPNPCMAAATVAMATAINAIWVAHITAPILGLIPRPHRDRTRAVASPPTGGGPEEGGREPRQGVGSGGWQQARDDNMARRNLPFFRYQGDADPNGNGPNEKEDNPGQHLGGSQSFGEGSAQRERIEGKCVRCGGIEEVAERRRIGKIR